jgi:mycofactocin biosynthesis protein MftB
MTRKEAGSSGDAGASVDAGASRAPFDAARPYEKHPQVAIRPESFGALAYHYGNRRLVFLKAPALVTVVETLGDFPSAAAAVAAHVPDAQRETYTRALSGLLASDVIRARLLCWAGATTTRNPPLRCAGPGDDPSGLEQGHGAGRQSPGEQRRVVHRNRALSAPSPAPTTARSVTKVVISPDTPVSGSPSLSSRAGARTPSGSANRSGGMCGPPHGQRPSRSHGQRPSRSHCK